MRWLLLTISLLLAVSGCANRESVSGDAASTTSSAATTRPTTPTTSAATTTAATTTTSTTGSTTTASTTTTTVPASVCSRFAAPVAAGALGSPELDEVSGIAASRAHPGILWVHNDSGGAARVWALDSRGRVLAFVDVGGAEAFDWEDIALGPGPDGDSLYIADIGDNRAQRTSVTIYRIPEPVPEPGAVVSADALRVIYPGGPADAEALAVDPRTGDLFIVTKRLFAPGEILRIPAEAWADGEVTAESVGELGLSLDALGGGPVTAADVSPDGALVAVRTYGDVWLWSRPPDVPIGALLTQAPCGAPSPPEGFGEALALGDGEYWTVSEGEGSTIWRIAAAD